MDAELVIESYKPLAEAYSKIADCQSVIDHTDSAELKRVMKKVQSGALSEFEQFLDIQVDGRLAELMDIARRELVASEQQEHKQQRRRTPQLLAVK